MQGVVGRCRPYGADIRSALPAPGQRLPRMKCAVQSSMQETGLLGDAPQRDYAEKLRLFNAFARPELREAIDALSVPAGSRVLDAGCGTGEALGWWHASMRDRGVVVGMDLSAAHARAEIGRASCRERV